MNIDYTPFTLSCHIKKFKNFRQKLGMGTGLAPFYSACLSSEKFSTFKCHRHGKVPYQKSWLKSMAHAVHLHINAMY